MVKINGWFFGCLFSYILFVFMYSISFNLYLILMLKFGNYYFWYKWIFEINYIIKMFIVIIFVLVYIEEVL